MSVFFLPFHSIYTRYYYWIFIDSYSKNVKILQAIILENIRFLKHFGEIWLSGAHRQYVQLASKNKFASGSASLALEAKTKSSCDLAVTVENKSVG